MSDVVKKSTITVNIGLNKDKHPVHMDWNSTDAENAEPKECKAMLLSLFDKDHMDTLKIDLWTNEMQVMEMDRFFFQTMRGLADTYFRATQNQELAAEMQRFVSYFGEKTGIIKEEK